MKSAEVAAALNLPIGTVKWHLFEARKELKHQTAPQIADALGVSPVYIEDEVARMADQGYLTEAHGSYRCAILLTEWTEALIRLSDNMYTSAAALIAPALADALSPAVLADENIILPPGSSRDYALWALIPWMLSGLPGDTRSFRNVATLRPDGGHNLCHAAITPPGVPQPALAGPMERFSGPCWNEQEGVTLWQIDTIWSEARISEMYQATEARVLTLLRQLLRDGDLDEEDYSTLVQRGVVRTSGTVDGLFRAELLPVWLRGRKIRERLTSLTRTVFGMHHAELEALRAPYAAALLADTPPHLRRLREYQLQGLFRDGRFMVHCLNQLIGSGRLTHPTEAERRSLHTVLLTD